MTPTTRSGRPALLGTGGLAALLVLAPLCDTVEPILSPLTGSTSYADLGAISAHETRFVVSVLVGALGTLCFLPALLGLTARTVQRAPLASRAAAGFAVAGLPMFMAVRLGSGVELQGLRDGIGRRATADLLDHLISNPIAAPMLILFLAGTVLGMVALAIAVWRSGLPKGAAVLIGLFPVVDMGAEGALPGWVPHVLLLVGLSWIARALLRSPDGWSGREGGLVAEDVAEHPVDERG